jgi:hypothetical protein
MQNFIWLLIKRNILIFKNKSGNDPKRVIAAVIEKVVVNENSVKI